MAVSMRRPSIQVPHQRCKLIPRLSLSHLNRDKRTLWLLCSRQIEDFDLVALVVRVGEADHQSIVRDSVVLDARRKVLGWVFENNAS